MPRLCDYKFFPYLLVCTIIILAVISAFHSIYLFANMNQAKSLENIYIEDTFSNPINDISELLDQSMTGVVYFGRDSCPECLVFNRIMQDEILRRYPELAILKFDTSVWSEHDLYRNVLDNYGITSIPAIVFLRGDGTFEKILLENMGGQEIVQKMVSLIESEGLD